jgi:predicted PhzF superfamily epimerase YddE/YHI9
VARIKSTTEIQRYAAFTADPAAALGADLRELRAVPDDAVLTLRQGDDMGRAGRITVTLTPDEDAIRVSGTAVPITD